jgi:hypothetical protein
VLLRGRGATLAATKNVRWVGWAAVAALFAFAAVTSTQAVVDIV